MPDTACTLGSPSLRHRASYKIPGPLERDLPLPSSTGTGSDSEAVVEIPFGELEKPLVTAKYLRPRPSHIRTRTGLTLSHVKAANLNDQCQ